jgi:hypothetical protein
MVEVPQYVMGNFDGTIGTSGFSSLPDAEYLDTFSFASVADCDWQCIGQDLSEVSGWRGGEETWIDSSLPWILRGQSSIFGYASNAGASSTSRIVLSQGSLWKDYCKDQGYAPVLCASLDPEANP